MSNIVIRKSGGAVPAPGVEQRDPFRMIRDLFRWDPFREMAPTWPTAEGPLAGFSPAFELKEAKDAYSFKADLPGIKDGDVQVTLTGNRLTIGGKREAEHEDRNDTYYAYERSYGSFTRAFTLPDGIDAEHVRADLKDGVLTVVVPKRPEAQTRTIPLQKDAIKS
jgi:HSP20 family protein